MTGKRKKKRATNRMFSLRRYVTFFILIAFVITCCMLLFLNELSANAGIALTEEKIGYAAWITFVNIVFLSLLCTVIDWLRRKFTVDRPVKKSSGRQNRS